MRIGGWQTSGLALLLVAFTLAGTPALAPDAPPSPRAAHAASTGLPPMSDLPTAIVAGRDGALWFTETGGDRIGRITTDGAVREFAIPTPRSGSAGIAVGPDGAIWFTEAYGAALGRLDPATGRIAEYPVPDLYGQPGALAVGGDGALYFTQNGSGSIGRFTPSTGRFAQFGLPFGITTDLARGPDGAIWFSEGKFGPTTIGRLGPDGSLAFYRDQKDFGDADVTALVAGPDGALWFAPTGSGVLGRLTTAGTFSKVSIPGGPALALAADTFVHLSPSGAFGTPHSAGTPTPMLWFASSSDGVGLLTTQGKARLFPLGDHVFEVPAAGLVVGTDDNVWCTLTAIDSIARLTPTGDEARFALPSAPPKAFDLETAPDGSAWVTLPEQNRVAHVNVAGAVRILRPVTHDSEPAGIAAAPDGSAWFSEYRAHRLAHVTAGGSAREYALPPQLDRPLGVVVAPDGMVWWIQYPFDALARLDPASGRSTYYPSTLSSGAQGIAAGADGRIWLSNPVTDAIDRFDPASGRWASFPVPVQGAHPGYLAAAPNGGVIFLLDGADQIGRVSAGGKLTLQQVAGDTPVRGVAATRTAIYFLDANPDHIGHLGSGGAVTYLQVPTANSDPEGIVAGPDGGVWFIEFSTGQLARIDPASGAIREYPLVAAQ